MDDVLGLVHSRRGDNSEYLYSRKGYFVLFDLKEISDFSHWFCDEMSALQGSRLYEASQLNAGDETHMKHI